MTQEEIIELARQAGCPMANMMPMYFTDTQLLVMLKAFAKLVAEKEREVVATWIMDKGFATGHGDSIVDLLDQLEWQIAEKEREACADICDRFQARDVGMQPAECAGAIRARGQA